MTLSPSIQGVVLSVSWAASGLGWPGYGSMGPLNVQSDTTQRDERVFLALYGIDEVKLTGIVKTRKGFQAIFTVPGTRKTFFAKVGDRFFDGEILGMTTRSVSVRQNVTEGRPGGRHGIKRELVLRNEAPDRK